MNVKLRLNWRLIFLLTLLGGLAIREVADELRPSLLRPGLHLYAYVGNTADGTVTEIDLVRLAAVATISVGAGPTGMRAHPTRPEIWGLSSAGGYAWVLDTKTGRIAARIAVGESPYALEFSPDGEHAYVAASGANTVVEIDCATRQIVSRVRAGRRPWIARISPDGKMLVVSNHDDASVSLFDAATLGLLATVNVTPHPEHIAVLPDSSKAFVSSGSVNQVSVIDLLGKKLLANVAIGGKPDDLILKPDGGELYIPSGESHGLVVINTSTNEAGDFLLLGMSPAAGTVTADGQLLYVSDSAAAHVVPVAIGVRQSAPPISVGQDPGTCLLTPGGDMLLVVDSASNDLAVLRAKTGGLITLIPVGPRPRDIAVKIFRDLHATAKINFFCGYSRGCRNLQGLANGIEARGLCRIRAKCHASAHRLRCFRLHCIRNIPCRRRGVRDCAGSERPHAWIAGGNNQCVLCTECACRCGTLARRGGLNRNAWRRAWQKRRGYLAGSAS